ncbi:unnamed protein product [Symbiodinium sp. CCMP2592]|nr:unnamed protein product [Symbiodinium sp. CCMP2592]
MAQPTMPTVPEVQCENITGEQLAVDLAVLTGRRVEDIRNEGVQSLLVALRLIGGVPENRQDLIRLATGESLVRPPAFVRVHAEPGANALSGNQRIDAALGILPAPVNQPNVEQTACASAGVAPTPKLPPAWKSDGKAGSNDIPVESLHLMFETLTTHRLSRNGPVNREVSAALSRMDFGKQVTAQSDWLIEAVFRREWNDDWAAILSLLIFGTRSGGLSGCRFNLSTRMRTPMAQFGPMSSLRLRMNSLGITPVQKCPNECMVETAWYAMSKAERMFLTKGDWWGEVLPDWMLFDETATYDGLVFVLPRFSASRRWWHWSRLATVIPNGLIEWRLMGHTMVPLMQASASGLHHDCSIWDELYEDDDGELVNAWIGPASSSAGMPSKKAKTMTPSSSATALASVANALVPGAEVVLRMNANAKVKLRDLQAKRRDVRAMTSEVTACASMKETAAPSAAGVSQECSRKEAQHAEELPGFENVVEIEASLLESWKSWSGPRLRDSEGRPVPSPPDRHLHYRHIARMDKLQKDVEEAHTAFEQVVALRRGGEAYVAAGNEAAGLVEPQAPAVNGLHLE